MVIVAAAAGLAVAGCPVASPQPSPAVPRTAPPSVRTVTLAELGASWHRGCPVGPESLRRVELDYRGFDGATHRGALVVNKEIVDDVVAVFGALAAMRYPIERMQTVEHYPGAEDELSMQDNNTSGFNCRPLGNGWSEHAYGRAVDVNPLVNPYRDASGDLQPKTAARYLDRTRDDLGLLHAGDAAVRAFTDRGWHWGGAWSNPVDYQHFEIP